MNKTDQVTELLQQAKTVAVVGLSDTPARPSYGVAAYLQTRGYRIVPVNPSLREVLGEKAYPSLLEVPAEVKIDIVDVFRRSEYLPEIVAQAIQRKVAAVWMQEGVIHEQAAETARQAGILVVMDRCILKEHQKRF